MKYISIIIVIFALLINMQASAQKVTKKMTVEDIASKRTAIMKQNLNLTPQQELQIKAIQIKYIQQENDLNKQKGSKQAKQSMKKQRKAEIESVLTPAQLEKRKQIAQHNKTK
jgi:hypothetical protein